METWFLLGGLTISPNIVMEQNTGINRNLQQQAGDESPPKGLSEMNQPLPRASETTGYLLNVVR